MSDTPRWRDVKGTLIRYDVEEIRTWQRARLASMLERPDLWSSTERSFAAQINALLETLDHERGVRKAWLTLLKDGVQNVHAIRKDLSFRLPDMLRAYQTLEKIARKFVGLEDV